VEIQKFIYSIWKNTAICKDLMKLGFSGDIKAKSRLLFKSKEKKPDDIYTELTI
jgi:hypothetical protein